MDVAVTATRAGLTPQQLVTAEELLSVMCIDMLHHGMCPAAGGDAELHALFLKIRKGYPRWGRITGHPGHPGTKTNPKPAPAPSYAYPDLDARDVPLPYLVRDEAIAAAGELIIAFPRTFHEELRSGTWTTVRRARALNRLILIVLPDGRVVPGCRPLH